AVTLFNPSVGPGGAAAVTPGEVGNPEIGPEVSGEIEVGFEAALLQDRVVADFTYFYQRVRDALGVIPLAPSEGFSGSVDGNIAQLDNWGWELSLDMAVLQRDNLAFNLGFTGAHSLNKVVDLGDREPAMELREGLPYPIYASDIILSADFDEFGQPTNVMCDSGTGEQIEIAPGRVVGIEPGGPPVPCAETEDYELMVGTLYPQYTWSFSPTLTLYRNLEIFGLIDGEFGRWGSETTLYCRNTPCFSNTLESLVRDDAAYVEGTVYYLRHPRGRTQHGIFDADFFKLREVGARYQIPQSWLAGFGVDRAAVSIVGRNLATLWQRQKYIGTAR